MNIEGVILTEEPDDMEEVFTISQVGKYKQIVICRHLIKKFCMEKGTPIQLYFKDEKTVIIRYPVQQCHICKADTREDESGIFFKGVNLCQDCVDLLIQKESIYAGKTALMFTE